MGLPGILQILTRLGGLRKNWLIATALAITFLSWLYLNTTWPDFPLTEGESVALFLIIFLILFFSNNIISVTKRWLAKRKMPRRNLRRRR